MQFELLLMIDGVYRFLLFGNDHVLTWLQLVTWCVVEDIMFDKSSNVTLEDIGNYRISQIVRILVISTTGHICTLPEAKARYLVNSRGTLGNSLVSSFKPRL